MSVSDSTVPQHEMTRLQRNTNIAGVLGPYIALALASPFVVQQHLLDWKDVAIFVSMYLLTGFGITIGFHRLFTHRAFEAQPWVRYLLAGLGMAALQGSVIDWVADHNKHHTFTDEEGDPHSPHLNDSALGGLWHAHMGWLFMNQGQADRRRYAGELMRDPGMRRMNKQVGLFILLGLAVPAGLGWWAHGDAAGALRDLVYAGFLRIILLNHVTWSINSICHFYGKRRFNTDDYSTNVGWLAPLSLGESWHHNHHAFPHHLVYVGTKAPKRPGVLAVLGPPGGLGGGLAAASQAADVAEDGLLLAFDAVAADQ